MADELADSNKPIETLTVKDVVRHRKRLRPAHRAAWAAKIHALNHAHWKEKKMKDRRVGAENRAAEEHLAAAGIVLKKSTRS